MSVFLEKSSENREIAKIAAENGLFNSATNRVYYSLFQKILHILNERDIEVPNQKDSHKGTIDVMIEKVLSNKKEKSELLRLHIIRRNRNIADYQEHLISERVYKSQVKSSADKIHDVLDNYI